MSIRCWRAALLILLLTTSVRAAQEPVLPPGDKEPLFRLETGGPTSSITALAFSPDGRTLYAAGWDKVVRVWNVDVKTGKFAADEQASYRVPIGPGVDGAINAIAVSADGTWLAVGGNGLVRGTAGFRTGGKVFDRRVMTTPMRLDQGMIYVFDTRAPANRPAVRLLRGHRGPVSSLAFAPLRDKKPPLLLSAAREWDADRPGENKWVGAVRLWDVAQSEELGSLRGLPDPENRKPGLSLWHTGEQRKQIAAAIAWEDGSLRLWNVLQDEVQELKNEGRFNNTALYLEDRGRVLAGSFAGGNGRLRLWQVGEQQPRIEQETNFAPSENRIFWAPRAVTLFSSGADGNLDHAATILRPSKVEEKYRLQIVHVERESGQMEAVQDFSLWPTERLPVIAAAPNGRYLAVAGNSQHEITLLSIADLFKKEGGSPVFQKLYGAGANVRYAAFVTNGKELALLLNEEAKTQPGELPRLPKATDLIFDFGKRRLTRYTDDWTVIAPSLAGWRVELIAAKPERPQELIVAREGTAPLPPIRLKKDQDVTDYALLPSWVPPQVGILAFYSQSHFLLPIFAQPQAPFQVPLLAVAFHERGEPKLGLYNAATGEQIREYAGHSEPIRSLAFSPDGRLLVSAADDQTICVWSLSDCDSILGRRGRLPGLTVSAHPRKQGVLVDQVDQAVGDAGLARGDQIEALVQEGKPQRLDATFAFHDLLWRTRPGSTIELQIAGKPPVKLPVGQGVDSRNPLFSLFLTQGDKPEDRQWIGWSPLGPYDASGRGAERYLGWHFNTGNPDLPARLALGDQYRKDFYREGFLKPLLEQGRPPSPRVAVPPPRPNMTLLLDGGGGDAGRAQPDAQGHILIREPAGTLRLTIDNYPSDKMEDWVSSIQWQVDDEPLQDFEEASGQEWATDLGQKWTWVRGVHKLRAGVRTQEQEAKEYSTEITLRYQPKPPQITLRTPLADQTVDKSAMTLQAEISPGLADQPVEVSLIHRHAKQDAPKERELKGPAKLALNERLTLAPGQNEITIVARNKDALAGYESWETSRRSLTVTYLEPREDPPPQISARVVPVGEDAKDNKPIEIQSDQLVVVHEPRIRIEGAIKAVANSGSLQRADWARGDAAPESLAKFTAGKHQEWPITTEITLQPGTKDNRFRFLAKTAHSPLKEMRVTVDYRPLLPEIVLTVPADGTFLYEGKDDQQIPIEARLIWPKHRHSCTWELLLNDSREGSVQEVETRTDVLAAKISLRPGRNTLQVRLRSAWSMSRVSEPVHVQYLRPPRILELRGPAQGAKPLVDLEARVSSASKLGAAEVDVNGTRKVVSTDAELIEKGNTETDLKSVPLWKVRLKDVPLDTSGNNVVLLSVRNEDAKCLEPASWTVRYEPPPKLPAPPEVEILDPPSGRKTSDPELKISFRIKSVTRPRQVELASVGDGLSPVLRTVDAAKLEPDQQGYFRGEIAIRLAPGLNNLFLTAGNEGGQQTSPPVAVSYTRVPVSLVIDRLEPWGQAGETVRPAALSAGESLPKEVATGMLLIHGRVLATNDQLTRLKGVWVYVNGIRQLPAKLWPLIRESKERAFSVPVLLNEAENQITIELSNLPQDAGNHSQFSLACRSPEKKQRLHLIIVGVGATDVKQLRQRALKAVQAEEISLPASESAFRTPAFAEGYIEGPRTTYVSRFHMNSLLANVRDRIKRLAKKGPSMSDVIMFYYQGRENVDQAGDLYWSDMMMSWNDMQNIFAETPGAHLLLLDVTRETRAKDRAGRWPNDARVGVLRAAWLGPKAPNEARLITALEETMPRAARMKDVESSLGNRFDEISRSFAGDIAYDGYLPKEIKNLAIGRGP